MIFLAYLIIGLLGGMLSGLLGLGGGIIMVTLLSEVFALSGFPESRVMQSAIATSLAIMLFTTSSAAYSHYRSGHLKKELLWRFLPGMMVGVVWGVLIAHLLSSADLELIFALFLLFIAYRLWFKRPVPTGPKPSVFNMGISSFLIGSVAGLLGLGGGALSVPYLLRYKISPKQAIALGAFFSFVAAVIGTLSWWLMSQSAPNHHFASSGYINWPAAVIAGVAGVSIVPVAVRWSKHLSELQLRRVLAVALIILFLKNFISWLSVVMN